MRFEPGNSKVGPPDTPVLAGRAGFLDPDLAIGQRVHQIKGWRRWLCVTCQLSLL